MKEGVHCFPKTLELLLILWLLHLQLLKAVTVAANLNSAMREKEKTTVQVPPLPLWAGDISFLSSAFCKVAVRGTSPGSNDGVCGVSSEDIPCT